MLCSIAFTEMGRLPASSIIATFPHFFHIISSSAMPSFATLPVMPTPIPPLVNQIGIPISTQAVQEDIGLGVH